MARGRYRTRTAKPPAGGTRVPDALKAHFMDESLFIGDVFAAMPPTHLVSAVFTDDSDFIVSNLVANIPPPLNLAVHFDDLVENELVVNAVVRGGTELLRADFVDESDFVVTPTVTSPPVAIVAGVTFTDESQFDVHMEQGGVPVDVTMALAFGTQPVVQLYRTPDAGNTWIRQPNPPQLPPALSRDLDFSPDSKLLAVPWHGSGADVPPTGSQLTIYNVPDFTVVSGTPSLPQAGYVCRFSPDGTKLAVGIADNPGIRVYNVADWTLVAGTPVLNDAIQSISWSPDGFYLAVTRNATPYFQVYRTDTWAVIPNAAVIPTQRATWITFNASGTLLGMLTNDAPFCRIYNVGTVAGGWTKRNDPSLAATGSLGVIAFSPDDKYFMVGTNGSVGQQRLSIFNNVDPPTRLTQTDGIVPTNGNIIDGGWDPSGEFIYLTHTASPFWYTIRTADWVKQSLPGIPPTDVSEGVAFLPFDQVGLVAVGSAGGIISSYRALSWKKKSAPAGQTANDYNGVVFNGEVYVAVSSTGTQRAAVSTNGITWTGYATPTTDTWRDVCWSPPLGLFVAVANGGAGGRVMTSPNGEVWTARNAPAVHSWNAVCWAHERALFCAVSTTGGVMTSPDGTNWTMQAGFPAGKTLNDVCFSRTLGLFCVVGDDAGAGLVYTSPDGVTWTARTPAVAKSWNSVCYSPERGMFVAVSGAGVGNRAMSSTDGITWVARPTPSVDMSWQTVEWFPLINLFVATASGGTATQRVMTSADGATWSQRGTPNIASNWLSLAGPMPYNPPAPAQNAQFVALASGANPGMPRLASSPDGVTWQMRAINDRDAWMDVTFSPERSLFVAVGLGNVTGAKVMTSPDGYKWTNRVVPGGLSTAQFDCVAYSASLGLFAVLGRTGTCMTSPDGTTWTQRTTPATDQQWNSLVWAPAPIGLFVAVGGVSINNRVMTSPDGITWTLRAPVTNNQQWNTVAHSPTLNRLVAVGNNQSFSRFMSSNDGITWTDRNFETAGAGVNWFSVIWAGAPLNMFIAFGELAGATLNEIATSPDGITWTLRGSAGDATWRYAAAWHPTIKRAVAMTQNSGNVPFIGSQYSASGTAWAVSNAGLSDGVQWRRIAARTTPAVPQAPVFDQSGDFLWQVPQYSTLQIDMWGGGGGSPGVRHQSSAFVVTAGTKGGDSVIPSLGLTARGGQGGNGAYGYTASFSQTGTRALGGTATGGDINTTGTASYNYGPWGPTGLGEATTSGGEPNWGGGAAGGGSPNGGGDQVYVTTSFTQRANMLGAPLHGKPGNFPGGGASGGADGTSPSACGTGGGAGGAFLRKTYTLGAPGAPMPGTILSGTVGAAGQGFPAPAVGYSCVINGANGAGGRVRFTVA